MEAQDVYVKSEIDASIADAKKAGTDAYNHVESLNTAMNTRVATLEEHKNDYIAADTTLSTSLKEYTNIAKTDAINVSKTYTDESIKDKVNDETFTNHVNDLNVHIGKDIRLDDDTVLYIVDKDGKIIAQFTEGGFDSKVIKQDGNVVVSKVFINNEIETAFITEEGVLNLPTTKYSSEGGVDLTGYATEKWVTTNYQPKGNYQPAGNYLTSIPSEYITETELSSKKYATETYVTSAIANAKLEGSDVVIPVEDVKVNGTSVITNRVAQIDLSNYASKTDLNSK